MCFFSLHFLVFHNITGDYGHSRSEFRFEFVEINEKNKMNEIFQWKMRNEIHEQRQNMLVIFFFCVFVSRVKFFVLDISILLINTQKEWNKCSSLCSVNGR